MATHGFIAVETANNGKILMHRFHDGYLGNMINDLLTLPFYYFNRLAQEESYADLIGKDLRPMRQMEIFMSNKLEIFKLILERDSVSYPKIVSLWNGVIFLNDVSDGLGRLLIGAYPFSYDIVQEPFILYGSPVSVDDADIKIEFIGDGTSYSLPDLVITITDEELEEDRLENFQSDIDELNTLISIEENKIKLENNKITMNIEKIICDLLHQKYKKPSLLGKLKEIIK